jgi:hypothetical protein
MWEFESSKVSQAVGPDENWHLRIPERPAIGGLLQFGERSPGSQFEELRVEIVESLRRFFEIFPFSGDGGRRPGAIYTV